MCHKCKFVNKNIVKEHKKYIMDILSDLYNDNKRKIKGNFNKGMVGSAKRNLVFQKGNSKWDIDIQIKINDKFIDYFKNDFEKIRNWFFEEIKSKTDKYYNLSNSTSVITLESRKKIMMVLKVMI